LSREPADRQQTMSQLAKELEQCRPDRRGSRSTAPSRQQSRLLQVWSSPSGRAAVAGAALLVLGAAGGIIWKVRSLSAAPAVLVTSARETADAPPRAPYRPSGGERTAPASGA